HDPAGLDRVSARGQVVGRERQRLAGVALHGGAGRGVDDVAVDLDEHRLEGEVEVARGERDRPGHVGSGAGVVGDDVTGGELEVRVPAVDDLGAAGDVVDGGHGLRGGDAGALEPLAHDEDELRLDAWVDQSVLWDRVTGGQDHRVREPGDEGGLHPHPLLLGPGGEAELDADQLLAAGEPTLQGQVLDLVAGGDVQPRPLVGELHTVAALVLAGEQLGGDRLDVPGGHRVAPGVRFIVLPCPGLAESWLANSAVTLPRPAKVAVKTSPGATGTMLVTEPGRTTWPASSRVPRTPTVLASHTRLVSVEPSTAPP